MKQLAFGSRASGFTLLELMVVVAILAVLAGLAGPSLKTLIDNQRLRNGSFDLVSDLMLARSEAITRRSAVVLTPASSDSDGWSSGWSLNLGSSAGNLVTSRSGLTTQLRFEVKSPSALSSLAYRADGRINGQTPVRIEVKYATPAPAGVSPSCISIDATGRPRADKGPCA